MIRIAAFLLAALAGAAASAQPAFRLPIDCPVPERCLIQNYVDMAPGDAYRDQTCGTLSYDGHKGVDFRLPDLRAMRQGVAVLAAADGVVTALRDGVPNHAGAEADRARAQSEGRECGNGVEIAHAEGWRTRYCHFSPGLAVRRGQRVRAGDRLGNAGMTGFTSFPHLHFVALDPSNTPVDPFTGAAMESGCGQDGRSLWAEALAYQAPALQTIGFTGAAEAIVQVVDGAAPAVAPNGPEAAALVFYARVIGLSPGDVMTIELTGPAGFRPRRNAHEVPRPRAQQMLYTGAANRSVPPGRYAGRVRVLREGRAILDETRRLTRR